MQKKYIQLAGGGLVVLSIALTVPFATFAQTTSNKPSISEGSGFVGKHGAKHFGKASFGGKNGISGTVTAVNGNSLSVSGKNGTTYTVDATNATVKKAGSSIQVSSIAVGDVVMVRGTVSGTSVTATAIMDGVPRMGMGNKNGIAGTVTAVSGTTITLTSRNGTVYAIDASSAKLTTGFRAKTPITVSDVKVGDLIVASGTVSGTSVVATTVNDNGTPSAHAFVMHKKTNSN